MSTRRTRSKAAQASTHAHYEKLLNTEPLTSSKKSTSRNNQWEKTYYENLLHDTDLDKNKKVKFTSNNDYFTLNQNINDYDGDANSNTGSTYSTERLIEDVKLYGNFLHVIIAILITVINIISLETMYIGCKLSSASIFKYFKFLNDCPLNSRITNYYTFSIILINLVTIMLIYYDKYQTCNMGYRVNELLISYCFLSGGFISGWPLLYSLKHKTKRLKFTRIAISASMLSIFWPQIYFILF